ncbi:MAG: GNAT family N-acetyltransferase [Xanthobacteraceae bacterium]|nr:GNAT family N-acetyltransferase [Xanthobacteraceae bacterium]
MSEAAGYSAVELLRDGRQIEIRAFRPEDRPAFIAAAGEVGPRSRYLRFFTLKRQFSEEEREFFLNVDFDKHVALVAVVEEAGQKVIVGAGRYVGVEPGKAEVAFTVIDRYQGRGIGASLVRHLVIVARGAGLHELVAEVLPENNSMLRLFKKSGLPVSVVSEPEVVHITMRLR